MQPTVLIIPLSEMATMLGSGAIGLFVGFLVARVFK